MTTLIALDWGTTSFRAYLYDQNDNIIDRISAPAGIMQGNEPNFENVLYAQVGEWLRQHPLAVVIASGMITSTQGWIETPYLPCPANLDDLSKNLVEHVTREGHKVYFVPGVCQQSPIPNIMRGEETQMAGLSSGKPLVAILPGTHSKWIRMQGETIVQFSTFMTGEVFAALTQHTILGRLITENDDPKAFATGVHEGFSKHEKSGGILSMLFGARAMPLLGMMEAASIKDYISGLLLGTEIGEALSSGLELEGNPVLCGSPELVDRYQKGLEICGVTGEPTSGDLAATGLLRIAGAAKLI
jgi:2-dehydro-3-deoxygalactonokinase